MKKISIIIGCYNSEETIAAALESVIKQNYENMEVIVIDDGSTDNSNTIIQSYRNKINGLRIISQENKGIAATRNFAVSLVSGEYFIYLDSDDTLNEGLLHILNDYLERNEVDILKFQALLHRNGTISNKYLSQPFTNLSGKEALVSLISQKVRYGPLWMYCYNTSYYKANYFEFPNGRLHEDFYNIYIIGKAKKISSIDFIGYNYVKRENSITTQKNEGEETKRRDDILYIYDLVVSELIKLFYTDPINLKYILCDLTTFLESSLKYVRDENKDMYMKEIDNRLNKNHL